MEKLYSCQEIADRYGVKVITVWDWIRKNKLSALKVGKQYRVSEESLKKFENSCIKNPS